jgi:hypothetical protein
VPHPELSADSDGYQWVWCVTGTRPLFVRLPQEQAAEPDRLTQATGRRKQQLVSELLADRLAVGRIALRDRQDEGAEEVLTLDEVAAVLRVPANEVRARAVHGDLPGQPVRRRVAVRAGGGACMACQRAWRVRRPRRQRAKSVDDRRTGRPLVLVPGACLGGWVWREVAARLRGLGHDVYPMTLLASASGFTSRMSRLTFRPTSRTS